MNSKRRIVAFLLMTALMLTTLACETMNQNRTTTGAVIGGVAGAAAGAAIDKDNRWRGAAIGTAAGGTLGAGVGHVLQKQKDAFDRIEDLETRQQTVILQQPAESTTQGEMASEPDAVQTEALNVNVSSDVLFERGSSALRAGGVEKVRELAQVLREYPDSTVYVRGYTSSDGDDASNFALSQRRAEVVRNELIASGIRPSRLFAQGMGESNPVASNETEIGRAQNRRVELIVIPRS